MTEYAPEPTEPEQQPAAAEAEQPAAEPASREARRYRHQLREVEAREAALSERLTAMQRAEVERIAAADLAAPADLWLAGTDLAELLDEDGNVDPERVASEVGTLLEARPGWKVPPPHPSQDGGARQTAPGGGPNMQDLLRGRITHPRG